MTEQPTEFAGLTALVTGGASGIGLATARDPVAARRLWEESEALVAAP